MAGKAGVEGVGGLDFLSRFAMQPWGEHARGGHDDKNTVCLACFNRRLAKAGWTDKGVRV